MRRPLPWRVLDVQVAVGLAGVGALVAMAGWWGTSQTATVERQVPWTALAVAGLLVAYLGAVWLVISGRLALRRRHGLLAARVAGAAPPSADAPPGVVVAGERMTRYHRPGCPAVAGKVVAAASVDDQRRAGRRPCQLCCP